MTPLYIAKSVPNDKHLSKKRYIFDKVFKYSVFPTLSQSLYFIDFPFKNA
jgi:hypothetical protein